MIKMNKDKKEEKQANRKIPMCHWISHRRLNAQVWFRPPLTEAEVEGYSSVYSVLQKGCRKRKTARLKNQVVDQ